MTTKYLWAGIRSAYIVYNNSGALGFIKAYLSKNCDLKPSSKKLEFAGDGQSFAKMYGYQMEGTIETDADNPLLDSTLWATPVVSPGGGDDFAQRWVRGTRAELASNFVELRVYIDGEDADTGAQVVKRIRLLKCQFDPDMPMKLASQAVWGRMLSFQVRVTATDILGNAVTGVPGSGGFWTKDLITNSTYFDPVSNDLL